MWQLKTFIFGANFILIFTLAEYIATTFTLAICFVPNYFDNKKGGAICRDQKYFLYTSKRFKLQIFFNAGGTF